MSRILFLHGPSSSGKSTLATAIRAVSDTPWLHLSIDHLRDSGAWVPGSYADWSLARAAFFDGSHRAVAGFGDAGNDLIVEHILDTPGWHTSLQTLLASHQVLFVGLRTPLRTLTRREAARGDRLAGSAARDHAQVQLGLTYDLELDGTLAPEQNANSVLSALARQSKRSNFFLADNTLG